MADFGYSKVLNDDMDSVASNTMHGMNPKWQVGHSERNCTGRAERVQQAEPVRLAECVQAAEAG